MLQWRYHALLRDDKLDYLITKGNILIEVEDGMQKIMVATKMVNTVTTTSHMDFVFDRGKSKQNIMVTGLASTRENRSDCEEYISVLSSEYSEVIQRDCCVEEVLVTSKDVKLRLVHVLGEIITKNSGMYIVTTHANRWHKGLQEKAWRNLLLPCYGLTSS